MPSLLVLTGVTRAAELWSAPPTLRPTSISWDLRGLLAPPLVARVSDPGDGRIEAHCAGSRARIVEGHLAITGSDPVAGLWAAAHAVWQCPQPPANLVDAAQEADRRVRLAVQG
jgi:hypothetical protein